MILEGMLYMMQEQYLLYITVLHLCPFWGTAQQKAHADILESSQRGSKENDKRFREKVEGMGFV